MTKQEQIEELQKTLPNIEVVKAIYGDIDFAELLYNVDCRKLPKDSVVLTKEEYEMLANQYKNLEIKYSNLSDNYKLCKDANETLKRNVLTTRKETAKEILNMGKKLYEMSYHKSNAMPRLIEWIKVEYGVEIGEENGKRKSKRD